MKRTLFVMAVVLGFATAASAATLTVVSDKASYTVGETITLSVSGDAQGELAYGAIGRLLYSAALTDTVGVVENAINNTWLLSGAPAFGDGFAEAFNQIALAPATMNGANPIAIITLTATGVGTVNVDWSGDLDFFSVDGARPGTSFEIVPEPTTAVMLGLGLFGLALGGRRRS
jgi:hypothetical protein